MVYVIRPLDGANPEPFVANIPGSKSLTNRALIIAAQRMGVTHIRRALHCEDTDHLANCLDQFGGLSVEKTADGYRVTRSQEVLTAPAQDLYVGGAGTPARFLLAFASLVEGATVITGNPRLSERPMGDLLRTFDRIGVRYECLRGPDHLPIRVHRSTASGRHWTIDGSTSSQFTSSLLLLAARQDGEPVTVTVENKLVSRPYVEMTLQMLNASGIAARATGGQSFVVEPGRPQQDRIDIEADASGMSYFLAAAALTRSRVVIPNIGRDSAQGDVGFARILADMGASVTFGANAIELEGAALKGVEVDMDHMPDTVLTLAAVAGLAQGRTNIHSIANLRVKECDRIHASVAELRRLGVDAEEGPDFITVLPGGAIKPARIETYDDHRVAMAFALPGLLHPGIEISNPKCVAKSFPEFWNEFERFRRHHALAPALTA
ncbi:3-phosphoshikimate 1-carboxyvinyltransferase [Azospirillum soli]|uniref:3-phosphoshikimate 1-carboxyvinyltransferase n=1 Tax=Azospirillum soli TaxID=1304799 RepID=UPI001AEA698A|nr:3-phosphoshikimate 1-carboxyvinyltransferase [Azospirillum soli]MBP2316496.1 3-phosphoshikimate 1-carboxyvinyltransferase [Azospirillum soli]